MEPRWASEIAHGVTWMTRSQGNEIVKKLLAKYEDNVPNAPKGKGELADLGIRFKF